MIGQVSPSPSIKMAGYWKALLFRMSKQFELNQFSTENECLDFVNFVIKMNESKFQCDHTFKLSRYVVCSLWRSLNHLRIFLMLIESLKLSTVLSQSENFYSKLGKHLWLKGHSKQITPHSIDLLNRKYCDKMVVMSSFNTPKWGLVTNKILMMMNSDTMFILTHSLILDWTLPYNCNTKESHSRCQSFVCPITRGHYKKKKKKSGGLPTTEGQDQLQICQISNMTLLCLWRIRACGLEGATWFQCWSQSGGFTHVLPK